MKKLAILFLMLITMLSLACCGNVTTSPEDEGKIDEYVAALKNEVNQEVVCFGETISDISVDKKTVVFTVDMSTADDSAFDVRDMSEVIFFRITDSALEVTDYDDLWNKMKVVFDGEGSITKTKDDIKDQGNGRTFGYDPDISWD